MKAENIEKIKEAFMDEFHINDKLAEMCANSAMNAVHTGLLTVLLTVANQLFEGKKEEPGKES